MQLTRGGALIGDVTHVWIPPGIPGFEEAGGLKQNNIDLDYLKSPTGDPAVSKKYTLAAKPGGPQPPDRRQREVDRWREDPHHRHERRPWQEDRRGLPGSDSRRSGFKLNFRIVPSGTLYTKFCGVRQGEHPRSAPNVGWFKDFADPQSMLDPTFNGDNILEQGNVNWPHLQRPRDQPGDEGTAR